jgi:hypothetical protein
VAAANTRTFPGLDRREKHREPELAQLGGELENKSPRVSFSSLIPICEICKCAKGRPGRKRASVVGVTGVGKLGTEGGGNLNHYRFK